MSNATYQPTVTFLLNSYAIGSYMSKITGLTSNVPASIYFVLISYKTIATNQITSKTNITLKSLVTPTADQIASCTDGSGQAAIQCTRVVMLPNSSYSVTFSNLA